MGAGDKIRHPVLGVALTGKLHAAGKAAVHPDARGAEILPLLERHGKIAAVQVPFGGDMALAHVAAGKTVPAVGFQPGGGPHKRLFRHQLARAQNGVGGVPAPDVGQRLALHRKPAAFQTAVGRGDQTQHGAARMRQVQLLADRCAVGPDAQQAFFVPPDVQRGDALFKKRFGVGGQADGGAGGRAADAQTGCLLLRRADAVRGGVSGGGDGDDAAGVAAHPHRRVVGQRRAGGGAVGTAVIRAEDAVVVKDKIDAAGGGEIDFRLKGVVGGLQHRDRGAAVTGKDKAVGMGGIPRTPCRAQRAPVLCVFAGVHHDVPAGLRLHKAVGGLAPDARVFVRVIVGVPHVAVGGQLPCGGLVGGFQIGLKHRLIIAVHGNGGGVGDHSVPVYLHREELHRAGVILRTLTAQDQVRQAPRTLRRGGGHGGKRPCEMPVAVAQAEGDVIVFAGHHAAGVGAAPAAQTAEHFPVGQKPLRHPFKRTGGGVRPRDGRAAFGGVAVGIVGLFPVHIVGGGIVGQQVFFRLFVPDKKDVRAAVGGEIVAVEFEAGLHAPAKILPAFALVFGTVNFEPAGQLAQIAPAVQTGVIVPCAVEIAEQRAVHRPLVGRGADADGLAQTLEGIKRGIAQNGVPQPGVHVRCFCIILFH